MLKAPIEVELFGHLCIRQGKRRITRFRTYKTGVLLAHLAFYGHRTHPREELIEMLWTDCDPVLGRNSLSQSLSSLRRLLEPPGVAPGEVLCADRFNVQLNPDAYSTDVAAFEETWKVFRSAERETDRSVAFLSLDRIYRGEFLPGYYEDWNLRERERLQAIFVQALLKRTEQFEAQGDIASAIECASRAVDIDSLNEEAHLRLMRLHVANNDHAHALRQFSTLSNILASELGVAPSTEVRRLASQLKAGLSTSTAARSSILKSTKTPSGTVRAKSTKPSGIVSMLVIETPKNADAEILRKLIRRHRGENMEVGQNLTAAIFSRASDALDCAVRIQRSFDKEMAHRESNTLPRLALHVGEVRSGKQSNARSTVRFVLDQTLELLRPADGGQLLCSEAATALLLSNLDTNVRFKDLGSYRLYDADKSAHVYQADYEGRTFTEFPPLKAEIGYESPLPLQLSHFFGREREIAGLRHWLDPTNEDVRLVTLTGPGGTGKTRLSLETAKSLQKHYQNAVWFVPLAHIAEPGFLPNAILDVMDLQPPAAIEPFKHLVTALSRNRSFLVLDNFEHWLSDSSPTFSDEGRKIVRTLLERVPTLRCLVTSRRRLGLFGEKEFPLEPLPVPFEPATIEEMSRCESVQLFVDRVQSARASFQITGANANVIAEICCRLEGIPLALELAAAQMQVLTPGQILKSLSRRLDFLTDRRRQVEARHQQLRATIDWSFQLLAPEAQTFFAALSVFRDGGNLSDVDAICNEPLALDHLALLQDFSFLRLEENRAAADMRFRLLETLREYGEEKLTPAECGVLRENHARHFLEGAETAAPLLKGETQSTWLRRLEQDHQNFLSALDWCLETANVESGLRLVCALSPFWIIHSHVRLGRERLSEFWNLPERESVAPGIRAAALSSAGELALAASDFASARSFHGECLKLYQQQRDLAGQAQALIDLGRTAFEQGDYMAARPFGEEGLKLWRKLGDDYGAAVSLNTLGLVACEQGNYAEALTSYNESLGLRRKVGDKRGIAAQLNNLGVVYRRQGNYEAAKRVFLESLEIQRELENRRSIAISLSNLGLVAEHEQDYAAARSLQEQSLSIRREVGDDWGVARSLTILGIINRHEGDDAAAQTLFEESLAICRRIGNKLGIGQILCNLGDLFSAKNNSAKAQTHLMESIELMSELNNKQGLTDVLQAYSRLSLAQGQYETSTKLFFAAKAIRRTIGAQLPPYEQTEIERQLTTLQTALGPEIFLKAQNSGVAMTIEQATRIAIEI